MPRLRDILRQIPAVSRPKPASKEADALRFKLVNAEAAAERLLQQRDNANRLVNQHEATIAQFNNAVQDLQDQLGLEQKLSAELVVQRDEARRELAEAAAENVALVDAKRHLEASLSGTREELRQERAARARAEQDAAEHAVTIDGLGLAMAEIERRVPTQRDGGDDV